RVHPVLLGSGLARLPPRRPRPEVCGDEDLLPRAVPLALVDLARRKTRVEIGALAPAALLQVRVGVHQTKTSTASRPATTEGSCAASARASSSDVSYIVKPRHDSSGWSENGPAANI